MLLDELAVPVVQAPMAGGPSTVELAAAVSRAGGLGTLAAGYKAADDVTADLAAVRRAGADPVGLNLFAPPAPPAPEAAWRGWAEGLEAEAERYGAEVGRPRSDDDGWAEKLALAGRERVPVVSVTFGCPAAHEIERLHAGGSEVWVTVTTPEEAREARDAGTDVLVVQGVEAGGHRGSFPGREPGDIGLLALLELVGAEVDLPLVASGGIMTGRGVAAALAAGARAAQLGTAFMLTPEAATNPAHREAMGGAGPTALTRAFTGRSGRGIVNRFLRDHDAGAPVAYPEVHHLTAPLRAAARARDDGDGFNLWAGQAYGLARAEPAGAVVARLDAELRAALAALRHPRVN